MHFFWQMAMCVSPIRIWLIFIFNAISCDHVNTQHTYSTAVLKLLLSHHNAIIVNIEEGKIFQDTEVVCLVIPRILTSQLYYRVANTLLN